MLAVLHDLNMAARYADRVAIVENGRVTNLGPTRATLDPERLSAVFATPIVRIEAASGTGILQPRLIHRESVFNPTSNPPDSNAVMMPQPASEF